MKRFTICLLFALIGLVSFSYISFADPDIGESSVGGEVDFILPTGDAAESYNMSYGLSIYYNYVFMRTFMLAASIAYHRWSLDVPDIQGVEFSEYSLPVIISLAYLTSISSFRMAFGLGLGYYSFFWSQKYGDGFESSDSDGHFGIKPFARMFYPLAAALILTAQLGYNHIFHTNSSFSYFVISAGIALSLSR